MYRHPQLAAQAQIEALRADLARVSASLETANRGRDDAERALENAREGVEPDPALEHDARYRWARRALIGLGLTGALVAIAGLVPLLGYTVAEPRLDPQGVENFAWHLRHGRGWVGLSATVGVLGLGSPWLVVPVLGAYGLRKTRRWGWFLAVVGCALYLPTPMMPVAALGLGVLLSGRVRRVYFPTRALDARP